MKINLKAYIVIGLLAISSIFFAGCSISDIFGDKNIVTETGVFEVTFDLSDFDSTNDLYVVKFNKNIYAYSVDDGVTWIDVNASQMLNLSYLDDGEYKLKVKNSEGNVSESQDVLIDTLLPEITTQRIENYIRINIVEANISTKILYKDNQLIEFTRDLYVDGNYKLVVTDKIGNIKELNFVVDLTNPIISTSENANNSGNFTLSCTENVEFYAINNSEWQQNNDNNVIHISGLLEGEYNIKVKDYYDNISDNLTLYVDQTSPILSIENNINNTGNFIINSNESLSRYFINQGDENILNGDESINLNNLEEGIYTLVAKDLCGNISEGLVIEVDKTSPVIDYTTVRNTSNNYTDISIVEANEYTLKLFKDDVEISYNNKITNDGNYVLIITDEAGNFTEDEFIVDLTAPELEINEEDSVAESLTIISNELIDSYSINGGQFIDIEAVFTFNIDNLSAGIYIIRAKDLYGNISNSISFEVYRDDINDSIEYYVERKIIATDGAMYDYLGYTIAIDNNYIVAGAYKDDDNGSLSGSTYIYDSDDETYERKIISSDGASGDYFGYSVAINGNYVVIGSYGSSSVYVYKIDDETYERKITPSDGNRSAYFGYSVAINGNYVVVGAYGDGYHNGLYCGSVYVYKIDDETYERIIFASDGHSQDRFGYSVAVNENYVVVGAYGKIYNNSYLTGAAYVYSLEVEGWERYITSSDRNSGDCFGYTVAVDGNYIVIGAYGDDDNGSNSGSAYIYKLNDKFYERKITASGGDSEDYFGNSVAISGNNIVIGSLEREGSNYPFGSAYVYKIDDETYERKIIASDGNNGDYFGYAVSIEGSNIIMGAYGDDDNGSNSGSIYYSHQIG
ncbi:MAG: FG-GAP repeat protein [Spirochaetales bacterium]